MKTMKSVGLALLLIGVAFTTGCERHSKKEVFYLVGVNMSLPYWQTVAKGLNQAKGPVGAWSPTNSSR